MNKRFKPALHGVRASSLEEYVVALGDASKALLSTAMLLDLDIHIAGDSIGPSPEDGEADKPQTPVQQALR